MDNSSQGRENRKYDRIKFELEARLRLPNGKVLIGKTENVSIRGCFLVVDTHLVEVKTGDEAVLSLHFVGQDVKNFPCCVVHVSSRGLGLDVTSALGMELTAAYLEATQHSLSSTFGVEVTTVSGIRCTMQGASEREEVYSDVIRLSALELTVALSSRLVPVWFKPHITTKVMLALPALPVLHVQGRVVSVTSAVGVDGREMVKHFRVRLLNLSTEATRQIENFASGLDRNRLAKLMEDRSQINMRKFYPEPIKKERKEIGLDLSRFFGR
ncbi:MAG: PilZ domain-containing protein [Magnetococcus sp. DMHC-6]